MSDDACELVACGPSQTLYSCRVLSIRDYKLPKHHPGQGRNVKAVREICSDLFNAGGNESALFNLTGKSYDLLVW